MKTEKLNEHYTMNILMDGQSSLYPFFNIRIHVILIVIVGTSHINICLVMFSFNLEWKSVYGTKNILVLLKLVENG